MRLNRSIRVGKVPRLQIKLICRLMTKHQMTTLFSPCSQLMCCAAVCHMVVISEEGIEESREQQIHDF